MTRNRPHLALMFNRTVNARLIRRKVGRALESGLRPILVQPFIERQNRSITRIRECAAPEPSTASMSQAPDGLPGRRQIRFGIECEVCKYFTAMPDGTQAL